MENKKIEKSVNIIIDETKQKLMQVIVQSGLPASISEMVIREIAENITLQSKQILEQEKVQYQEKLQEAAKKVGVKDGNKE